MKLEHSLTSYAKINAEWIKDLNVRLEENISRKHFNITCTSIFLDPSLRVREIKINKWVLLKLKSFCTAKENNKQKEKITYRMREDTCKECHQQMINFKNIWRAHIAQY